MARIKSTPKEFAVDTAEQDNTPKTAEEAIVGMPYSVAQNVVNLIDLLSLRGAFKGDELLGVGALRQNVVQAIQAPR